MLTYEEIRKAEEFEKAYGPMSCDRKYVPISSGSVGLEKSTLRIRIPREYIDDVVLKRKGPNK